jgi:putative oxidoreductase
VTSSLGSALNVLGRAFLSAIFFVSGFRKLEDPAAVATRIGEALAKAAWAPEALAVGVRQAGPLLAWSAIGFEFLGAFCLVTGFKKEFGAALLVIFLVPTTLLFHPPQDPTQMNAFLKNVAIIGGLLLVVASPAPRSRVL